MRALRFVMALSMLASVVAALTAADAGRADIDPTWPLRAEQARRQTEAAFAELRRGHGVSAKHDLVEAGLTLFAGVVKTLLR